MDTWEELQDFVGQRGDVASVEMIVLRDIHDVKKLGIHVVTQISNKLKGVGLGHYPTDLPLYQEEYVRLYRLGTPTAELIGAVLDPSEENDAKLREIGSNGATELLDRIRALVSD